MLEEMAGDDTDSRGELMQETEALCQEIQELYTQEQLVSLALPLLLWSSFLAGISLLTFVQGHFAGRISPERDR